MKSWLKVLTCIALCGINYSACQSDGSALQAAELGIERTSGEEFDHSIAVLAKADATEEDKLAAAEAIEEYISVKQKLEPERLVLLHERRSDLVALMGDGQSHLSLLAIGIILWLDVEVPHRDESIVQIVSSFDSRQFLRLKIVVAFLDPYPNKDYHQILANLFICGDIDTAEQVLHDVEFMESHNRMSLETGTSLLNQMCQRPSIELDYVKRMVKVYEKLKERDRLDKMNLPKFDAKDLI
jgi:hypothetical protein